MTMMMYFEVAVFSQDGLTVLFHASNSIKSAQVIVPVFQFVLSCFYL